MLLPEHILPAPAIAEGYGLTLTFAVAKQPLYIVYVIVAVPTALPGAIPATFTGATVGSLVLHVPPPVVLLSVADEPIHTLPPPEILAGD
jgi:hypothetical protein